MSLQGSSELRARLAALRGAGRPIARSLGTETVTQARGRVRVRTGRTRDTLRLGTVTEHAAQILGSAVAVILDRGARERDIEPRARDSLKFTVNGRTVFSKRVHKPRQAGDGFIATSGREAARKAPIADAVIDAWNGAA